jgi:hypothetical protein
VLIVISSPCLVFLIVDLVLMSDGTGLHENPERTP